MFETSEWAWNIIELWTFSCVVRPEAGHQNQATINFLPPPTKFGWASKPINQTVLWPKLLRHYECHRIASGLQNKMEQKQKGTLLYFMGQNTHDIIKTLRVDKETLNSHTEVRAAFNSHFADDSTPVPEESIDTFIQDFTSWLKISNTAHSKTCLFWLNCHRNTRRHSMALYQIAYQKKPNNLSFITWLPTREHSYATLCPGVHPVMEHSSKALEFIHTEHYLI